MLFGFNVADVMGTLVDFAVVADDDGAAVAAVAAVAAALPTAGLLVGNSNGDVRVRSSALALAAVAAATAATLSASLGTLENGMIVTGAIGEKDR
jgi:hypothetical protein